MRTLSLAGLWVLGASSAFSGTITFGALTGSNGDPFTTYSEGGFTVNATTGTWNKAFLFGNPIPDIFSGSLTASVTVTGGGLFFFASFDFGNANTFGGLAWSAAGFRNGVQVLTGSG